MARQVLRPVVRPLQEARAGGAKAAKALKKEVGDKAKLGAVDCDDATNKALCAKFNVNGFPTLKGFASQHEAHDFDGARDADGIVQFVKTKLAAKTTASEDKLAPKLTYHDAFNFLNVVDGGRPRLCSDAASVAEIEARDQARVPSWWTSTAVKYKSGRRKDVAFAWVRHEDDPGVARNFKLDPRARSPSAAADRRVQTRSTTSFCARPSWAARAGRC